MNAIYLYKSGELKRKDSSLVLINSDETVLIPIEQVDTIFVFGEITINKRLLQLLNKNGITMVFFNYYGNYIGRFTPVLSKAGKNLIEQVNAFQTPSIRLHIIKAIQFASFRNMINLCKYYQKKKFKVTEIIRSLENNTEYINRSQSPNEILMIEARSKHQYYQLFDIVLQNYIFSFEHRSKKPPHNEMNALLSYGYSLLYANILSMIESSRLIPEISFIHSVEKKGPSLQYDIADIFKPFLVDRTILRMIRKKQIKEDHFEFSKGICYLNSAGIKIFVNVFEEVLNQTITINGKSYSYRSVLKREINQLANFIMGKTSSYSAFVFKW